MDYKYKYLKYKNKYIALKEQYAGGNSIILSDTTIKGPSYMCHLNSEDKNIYLFGEIHKNLSDITCINGWKTMFEWLNKDIIPKYKDDHILDIFIEKKKNKTHNRNLESITNRSLSELEKLVIKPTKNTRIHKIDIRYTANILEDLGELDSNIRYLYFNMPKCKEIINNNHSILLKCLDIIIDWSILIFFKSDKIIIKEKLLNIINTDLTKYINDLKLINTNSKFNEIFIDMTDCISDMNIEILSQEFNFDFLGKYRNDGIIFTEIYDNIDEKYKKEFLGLNKELFNLKDQFDEKYKKFKDLFYEKLNEKNYISPVIYLEIFNRNNIFLEFNSITMICFLLVYFMSLFMDIYIIGKLLKSNIKSCIIYTGIAHTKYINNKLQKLFGFKIKYEPIDINLIKYWPEHENNALNCLNLKNLNLSL